MGATFVIALREGIEASLIVSILLAYLKKIERPDGRGAVWAGTLVAAAVSAALTSMAAAQSAPKPAPAGGAPAGAAKAAPTATDKTAATRLRHQRRKPAPTSIRCFTRPRKRA